MTEEENNEAEVEETPEAEAPEAAEQAPAPEVAKAEAPAADEEPAEVLSPKERRRKERSEHTGEANPSQTIEERAAARAELRKKKAKSRTQWRAKQRAKKGEPGTGTPAADREPGNAKLRQGIVTSSKADKTITVQIQSARRHPAYEKVIRRSNALHAHDENNEAGEGDTVRIIETRPMSKSKRWRLVEIVEKAR